MISAPANSEPDFYGAMIREDRPAPGAYGAYRDAATGKGEIRRGRNPRSSIRRDREFCGTSETFANVPADRLHYL
jgi:hypothetical protein